MVKIIAKRDYTIKVLRRNTKPPKPMSASPRESFDCIFTTRANVSSRGGLAEVAQVSIGGVTVSHVFSIRYTSLITQVDTQCVVRDMLGHQWRILKVEDKDLANREIKLMCADMGQKTVEAAR